MRNVLKCKWESLIAMGKDKQHDHEGHRWNFHQLDRQPTPTNQIDRGGCVVSDQGAEDHATSQNEDQHQVTSGMFTTTTRLQ